MPKALVMVGFLPVTLLMALTFWRYSDHSWIAAAEWSALYASGVVIPGIWARRAHRAIGRLEPAIAKDLRGIPYYIAIAGLLPLLLGLALIRLVDTGLR